ncbi:hypothetical protein FPV67DRAFT_1715819 [Lyophyllum atratum]|nr:hypothetical protein FPV67DRAFT_1715819 [Lyophyllum atratum]
MSSPTPSPTPTPSKSRWARMGGVVRRASSVLVVTRPSTPSIASSDRDADSTSIKNVPATAPTTLTPPKPAPSQPSPIAESPARERAASEDLDDAPTLDPSPLAQLPVTATPTDEAESEQSAPEITQTSPVQEYTPPPLIDSTAVGPGGFTDEPDELPQSVTIRDPSFIQPDSTDGHDSTAPVTEPEQPATPPVEPVAVPYTPEPIASEPLPEPATPEPVTPPPGLAGAGVHSYFDIPVQEEPFEDPELTAQPREEYRQADDDEDVFRVPAPVEPVPETNEVQQEEIFRPRTPAPDDEEPQPAPQMPAPRMPTPAPEPAVLLPAAPAYPLQPFDYHSGQEVWGGIAHGPDDESKRGMNGNASTASSIRMPMENPFADPIAPRITVSQPAPPMPQPHTAQQDQRASSGTQGSARGVAMPLPPVHEVILHKSLHEFPSTQSLRESAGGPYETDETRPLLSRPGSPKDASYLQPSATSYNAVNVSSQSSPAPALAVSTSSAQWPLQHTPTGPRLHDLGWLEYQLPDGTVYYVHPTRRVTADLDLREERTLEALSAYFEDHKDCGGAPQGMELWLRESVVIKGSGSGSKKKGKGRFEPARFWVNHKQRMVSVDQAHRGDGGKWKVDLDDQLDIEYRYWSFMEGHPAHTALPPNARVEATDVLTWAWTDRLLPSHRSVPAPFTQEECQELMSLLRSFEQNEGGLQTVVHTRIVSRILLRVAHWRQQHFRPNKPLPTDVGQRDVSLPKHRRPLHRALTDFLISCLCLGIPYIFFDRSRPYHLDEESGMRSAAGPMFIVGACTCLVAAIVLSASVTFLSLPGLDNFARVAGFVAILFAAISMAATLVALFRYKADLENPVSHIASEGLTMLSRRSVVFSLPLVFLAYSIVAFITGIVLYSFRGLAPDPYGPSQGPFVDYTRWTIVGVLGGLAGVVTTSLLLLRR